MPTGLVLPGSLVQLVCSSLSRSNETQLVWYNNGERVDDSSFISADHVINQYDFYAPNTGPSNLECRLVYKPVDLKQSAWAKIRIRGVAKVL